MELRALSESDLALELSTFCGRQSELRQLRHRLATDRLVTITGVGGVGKTRLVIEHARSAVFDFPDGVHMVELAFIGNAGLVGTAIAEATGVRKESGESSLDRTVRRLRDGRQLLILDNCEHVGAEVAEATWHLLTRCAGLTILATSREPLGVRGERVLPLGPLPVPESSDLGDAEGVTDAVQLFADRAQLLGRDGQLPLETQAVVADICRRVDGLPLAVELAAAWLSVLSLEQVRDHLDGSLLLLGGSDARRQSRHSSIRSTLDWSERLLTPAQATSLARLSVFVGGFSLDGAAAVLDASDEPGESALELVAALVTRSLVTARTTGDAARYRLLEPVRQYAADRLRARGDDVVLETRARHLRFLADLAETAEEHIVGGPDQPWLVRLDAELGNIRAALAWGFDNEHETASRLATALVVYCRHRGLFREGAAWAHQAARSAGRQRARALCMEAWLLSEVGETGAARPLLDDAYRLAASYGDDTDITLVLTARALAEYVAGDLAALQKSADEGVAHARRSGNPAHLMWALWAPAVLASATGDDGRCFELFSEAHAIAMRLNNTCWGSALAISVIDSAADAGDLTTALPLLRAELQCWTAADPANAGYLIEDAAIVAIQQGDVTRGLRLLAAGRAALARISYRETPDEASRRCRWSDAARQQMDRDVADSIWRAGSALTTAAALDEARAVVAEPSLTAPAPQAGDENVFVREGEFWTVSYAGMAVRVRDSKGIRDLAILLAARGQSVAAVDLAGGASASSRRSLPEGLHSEGNTGGVIDAQARAQYRTRLIDLDEIISDADQCNDPHRASRARDEREFLLTELGAAVGLSGRARVAGDPAERARKAVTWRVRDAISRIEAAHAVLGRHLRLSVRTGSFCRYEPDQATQWSVITQR